MIGKYCEKCGAELDANYAYCPDCGALIRGEAESGETTNSGVVAQAPAPAPAPVPAPAPPPRQKRGKTALLIVVIVALAAIIVGAVAYFNYANDDARFLAAALAKSGNEYRRELTDFININPTLAAYLYMSRHRSSEQQFIAPEGRLTIRDDDANKVFHLSAQVNEFPLQAAVYLSDDRLVAGVPGILLAEANPKKLGDSLRDLIEKLSALSSDSLPVDTDTQEIEDAAKILNSIDFSYSAVKGMAFGANNPGLNELRLVLSRDARKLIDRAELKRTKGEIEIAGKTEKTDELILTISPGLLRDWLTRDFIPALRQSDNLRQYWRIYDMSRSASDHWYDSINYDEAIDELQDMFEDLIDRMTEANGRLTITLRLHKGVIVEVACRARIDRFSEEPGFIVSALGAPRRLNDISIVLYGEDSARPEFQLSVIGDHFNAARFNTAISVRDQYSTERINIDWDLASSSDNLRIRSGGDTLVMTLTSSGDEVAFRYDDFKWSIRPFDEAILIPDSAIMIKDLNLNDYKTAFADLLRQAGGLGLGGLIGPAWGPDPGEGPDEPPDYPEDGNFLVVNNTGYDIYYLRLSPSDGDWDDEFIGDGVFEDGDSMYIYLHELDSVVFWDVWITDEDFDDYYCWDLDLEGATGITLKYDFNTDDLLVVIPRYDDPNAPGFPGFPGFPGSPDAPDAPNAPHIPHVTPPISFEIENRETLDALWPRILGYWSPVDDDPETFVYIGYARGDNGAPVLRAGWFYSESADEGYVTGISETGEDIYEVSLRAPDMDLDFDIRVDTGALWRGQLIIAFPYNDDMALTFMGATLEEALAAYEAADSA